MAKIKMHLQIEHYLKIKNHEKTVELRLNDEKRRQLKIGDVIEFYNSPDASDTIETEIINLHKSATFEDLLNKIGCSKCGFDSIDDVMRILQEYYPIGEQQKYGVLGIEIKCL